MPKKKTKVVLTPEQQQEADYQMAIRRMEGAGKMLQAGDGMQMYKEAIRLFEKLDDYKDSKTYKKKCEQKLPQKRKQFRQEVYQAGMQRKEQAVTASDYEDAIAEFERLKVPYKDIPEQIAACRKLQEQALKKEGHKKLVQNACILLGCAALVLLVVLLRTPAAFYQEGKLLMAFGDYERAENLFAHSRDYKDTPQLVTECSYQRALMAAEDGSYAKAVKIFQKYVGDYKDAQEQKAKLEQTVLSSAKEGETVIFGTRQWLVTEVRENEVLLVQKKPQAEEIPYDSAGEIVTWEKSDMRNWLNTAFYEQCFSSYEQGMMQETTHGTAANGTYGTDGGNSVMDRIFLLDEKEAEQYASKLVIEKYRTEWWLRTPGNNGETAEYVSSEGIIRDYGYAVNAIDLGVRPAVWIRLQNKGS